MIDRRLLALLGLLPALASAQNLLSNPGFSTAQQLQGWGPLMTPDMNTQWANLDSNGSPDSGSLQVTNISPGPQNGVSVGQCLPVVAGAGYVWNGKVRVPTAPGQLLSNQARISLRWYSNSGCTSPIGGAVTSSGTVAAFDTWYVRGPLLDTAPVGALSVEVRALNTKVDAGGNYTVLYDDLSFQSERIFGNGFEN